MRILQVSKFFPPDTGGIETVAYELAEGFAARGANADVLCANTSRETLRGRALAGYGVVRAGSFGVKASTSMSLALLVEFRRVRREYDVIHIHLPNPLANLAAWLTRTTSKIVVHWHSDIINQPRALKLYAPLQDWLLKRADAIIATSQAYVDSSTWLSPYREKVFVIPIGMPDVDEQSAHLKRASERKAQSGSFVVFSMGRMTSYKGFDVLIEAARALPSKYQIKVGGGGEMLNRFRALAHSSGLSDRIQFLGRISNDEAKALYGEADVFCLASTNRAEAFGVVLVEALAFGIPIVATTITGSGVPWVNQHGITGLNVPPHDPLALAGALRQICENQALARSFSIAARTRYEQRFSSDVMVDAILQLYETLLRDDL